MHPTDKKQTFIERRAAGHTLSAIAKDLQVSKTTIWRWNQDEEDHIHQLQTMYQEEAEKTWHQKRLQRLVDLQTCGDWLHEALVEQMGERADKLCLKEIFLYMNLLRAEMDHYRLKPLATRSNPGTAPKTEQNGTELPESGTPAPNASPLKSEISNLSSPELTPPKTEQNGTPTPGNGTLISFPHLKSQISDSESLVPAKSPQTEQNGTEPSKIGTPLPPVTHTIQPKTQTTSDPERELPASVGQKTDQAAGTSNLLSINLERLTKPQTEPSSSGPPDRSNEPEIQA